MAKVAVVLLMFGLYFPPCLAMMTGGIKPMNEASIPEVVKEGVRLYLESISERHPFDYKVKCDKLEASSQLVQGFLYRVALEIVPVEEGAIHSYCISGSDNVRLEKDVKFVCLEIWSRTWLKSEEERLIVKEVDEPHKRNNVESCLEVNDE